MKFFFLLARRVPDGPSRVVLDVRDALTRRGHQVASVIAEEELTALGRIGPAHDLCLLKSYTELSLSLSGALEARGAHLINPHAGCVAVRNKIVCQQMLWQAGVPVPESWVTGDFNLLRSLVRRFPLILKPYMGWRGQGICIVRDERDLGSIAKCSSPMLVQRYIPNRGEDLRIYVAGDEVFATRKPFSSTSFSVAGEPAPVSAEIRDIALRCGRLFGLRLYGLDIIEGADGPRVVDVNYFPGYKGVPHAARIVADYVEAHAQSLCERKGESAIANPAAVHW